MENQNNRMYLCGKIVAEPEFDHEAHGEKFYRVQICVPRLSGTEDVLPLIVSKWLLNDKIAPGKEVAVSGQIRTYNFYDEKNVRHVRQIGFVQSITDPTENSIINSIHLKGTICHVPIYRTTPRGRQIADMTIAVNRGYEKSDYVRCVAWGRAAHFASTLETGDKVDVTGRFQSREYTKVLENGENEIRVAYEMSLNNLSLEEKKPEHPADEEVKQENEKVCEESAAENAEEEQVTGRVNRETPETTETPEENEPVMAEGEPEKEASEN